MAQSLEDVLQSLVPQALVDAKIATTHVMVRCPFHGAGTERTPSCSLSRMKPVFFCHGCSTGGHITKYLRAVGASVDKDSIEKQISYDYSEYGGAKTLHGVFSGANPYRGRYTLDDDILDEWRLRPETLYRAGFTERTLRYFEVGVDHASTRITFPLRNLYGELVGVSGRALMAGIEPRYKVYTAKDLARFGVSPDYTMASMKGALLWHAHLIFPICFQTATPIVLCEGFKAAMWVWQAGFHNVVALVGSHLTKLQAELIARTASPVILFLDNNGAGRSGTHVAAKRLVKKSFLYVATYPDLREQPDALGQAEVHAAIDNAKHYVRWKLENREEKKL